MSAKCNGVVGHSETENWGLLRSALEHPYNTAKARPRGP